MTGDNTLQREPRNRIANSLKDTVLGMYLGSFEYFESTIDNLNNFKTNYFVYTALAEFSRDRAWG